MPGGLHRRRIGPRRTGSVASYRPNTRILAFLALLACSAAVVSDDANERFWERHALLAGLAASVIVVMLTVAVVNEVLERRSRQRWSILAQYVMLELVRNARMIWSGILEVASLLPTEPSQQTWLAAGAGIVRDTPRLTASLREIAGDAKGRRRLHDEVAFLARHADDVLGQWAAVMLNADTRRRMARESHGRHRPARRGARSRDSCTGSSHRSVDWWRERLGTAAPRPPD